METLLLLSMGAFGVGFFIAKSQSEAEANGPNPPKNYEKMIESMNAYRESVGVEPIKDTYKK